MLVLVYRIVPERSADCPFASTEGGCIVLRMTNAELFAFISGCKLAVLGSVSPEGDPQSALVGIAVTEKLEIIFDTLNTARKFRNLAGNSKASFVIGWAGEKTVQFEGEAFLPAGDELERYKKIYFRTWLDGPARQSWPGIVEVDVQLGGANLRHLLRPKAIDLDGFSGVQCVPDGQCVGPGAQVFENVVPASDAP